jgi:DNA-directed RNA polymerase subunit L
MDPEIFELNNKNGVLTFTLKNVDVSIANSIRRFILSEIESVGFVTLPYEKNQATIHKNTTRLNNEILKQRISCIPVHIKDISDFPSDQYVIEVNEKNEDSIIKYVTTEHIKIKNVLNNTYLERSEVEEIFPKNEQTGYYIDIVRLRPEISDTIKGESLHFTCKFSTVSSKKDGCTYNIVSSCTYQNTKDEAKSKTIWDKIETKLKQENELTDSIRLQKSNYMAIDACRNFIKDSFDFSIESVGIYDNKKILVMGINGMIKKFRTFIELLNKDQVIVQPAQVDIENSYDIILDNEDYTLGKPIEYMIYTKYFQKEKSITFCGFRKNHPHDNYSVIRVASNESKEIVDIYNILNDVCSDLIELYTKIKGYVV